LECTDLRYACYLVQLLLSAFSVGNQVVKHLYLKLC